MRRLINRWLGRKDKRSNWRKRKFERHAGFEQFEDRRMLCAPPPNITVNDVSLDETNNTTKFTVSLSQACMSTVTVDYDTSEASGSDAAESGVDFTATSGTLTFQPFETSI